MPRTTRKRLDALVNDITAVLPVPVVEDHPDDGTVRVTGGDPGEVVVELTKDEIRVAEFTVEWHGPHEPVVVPNWKVTVSVRGLRRPQIMKVVSSAVEVVRSARRSKYRTCSRCGERKPPE